VSSATNFGVSVVAVRELSTAEFGAFALALTTYYMCLGISRALASEPLMVRFGLGGEERRSHIAGAAGTALVVGCVGGAVAAIAGAAAGGPTARALLLVGVAMPALLVQDAWRFAFFATARPVRAAANDTLWAVAQIAAFAGLVASHRLDLTTALLAWACSAAIAAIGGAWQAGVAPAPRRVRRWLTSTRDLGFRFVGEFVAVSGTSQAGTYVLGLIAGLAALGTFRAALVIFGPLNILFLAANAIVIPELVRLRQRRPDLLFRTSAGIAVGLASIPLLFGVVALALPARVGRDLMGQSWPAARPLIPAVAAAMAAAGVSAAFVGGLRALQAASRSFRLRLAAAPVVLCGYAIGSAADGALGAITAGAITNWLVAVGAIWALRRECGRSEVGRSVRVTAPATAMGARADERPHPVG
jgi:O-antigen/teichoic acid export membrane protein